MAESKRFREQVKAAVFEFTAMIKAENGSKMERKKPV